MGESQVSKLHWSTSMVSAGSGSASLVGEKVALSVLMDDAGDGGLHCTSSPAGLLRLRRDSTAVDVRWSNFPVSCKF